MDKKYLVRLGGMAATAVVGGALFWGGSTANAKDDNLKDLSRALVYLKTYYYQDVNTTEDTRKMVEHAINGMLATLDPHTVYHSPESFSRMQEEQKGEFAGIGITFSIRNEFITVISVLDNTPSARLGLRPGDMIVKIEGEDAKGISSYEVVNQLRGRPGTKVNINVKRPGLKELLEFDITRESIPLYSVPYAYMMEDNKTGYISVSNFAERTREELIEKMDELEKEGMKRLVLDLRGNPGGLLSAAREVSEVFLPEGVLIVETKGRIPESRLELYSERDDGRTDLPLVVLVDGGSASASEIVSGAVQDHDRGLVVGTRSFGKGLVQRLFDVNRDAAVQLTTAQYYTPSGRCIQRPFNNNDFQLHIEGGEIRTDNPKSEGGEDKGEKFYTVNNRVVYGGGGIQPDLKVENEIFPGFIGPLRAKALFFNYAIEHVNEHRDTITKDFELTDDVVKDFIAYAKKNDVELDQEAIADQYDVLKAWLSREIASAAFDTTEGIKRFNRYDTQIQAALENFGEAEEIMRLGKR